jgi:hypothetical protein
LQRGDRLVTIGDHSTEDLSHTKAVDLLVAAGQRIKLSVERGGEAIPTGEQFRLASEWRRQGGAAPHRTQVIV